MPKIVVNEFDNTSPGTGEYANFSVVVPGFLGTGKTLSELQSQGIFDENGIYECNSQAEFVENVGKISKSCTTTAVKVEGKAPKIHAVIKFDENQGEATKTVEGETIVYTYSTHEAFKKSVGLCVQGYLPTEDETDFGKGQATSGFNTYVGAVSAGAMNGKLSANGIKYKPLNLTDSDLISGSIEIQMGDDNTLEIVSDDYVLDSSVTACYVIKAGDEGTDAITEEKSVAHYGNQIAYELLGLGYTILYKAMDCHSDLSNLSFWEALKDKSTYDFRYVLTGLRTDNELANTAIISLCDWNPNGKTFDDIDILEMGRGDCFALVDIDEAVYAGKTQSQAIPAIAEEANKFSSASYAAVFAPYVTYTMAEDPAYNKNTSFPASFHYLACAARSSASNYAEWYANAGYTRGLSKYTVKSTGCKLGELAIQALQPRFIAKAGNNAKGEAISTNVAVNLVVKIKESYYLWGNRTSKPLESRTAGDLVAQHFLNIRQLCTTIKKQVYVTCRRLTFDPNSNILWINFRALLTPMLEQMKADQGIRDYEFVRNETDRKAFLSAKIRIVPIEAVEDFEIDLYLEDSLSEATVTEA